MSEATPRPWIWDEPSNWLGLSARVCTEKYEPIAQVQLSGWPHRVGLANTDLIVRAVNCHDDLLAACKALLKVVDRLPNGHSEDRVTSAALAFTAIAKAKGK